MNSLVNVDLKKVKEEGEEEEELNPNTATGGENSGIVSLPFPSEDDVRSDSTLSDDCIPVLMKGIPFYISHTSSGSPLYIRQHPPTLDEILRGNPNDLVPNFDGFSEASEESFEGFDDASNTSTLFEGFTNDTTEVRNFSAIRHLGNDVQDYDFDYDSSDDSQPGKKSPVKRSAGGGSKANRGKTSKSTHVPPRKRAKEQPMPAIKNRAPQSFSQPGAKRRYSTEKQVNESPLLMGKKPRKVPSPGEPDYIGEYCNEIGCTVSFLERMAYKDAQITNGVVQELSDFASKILWEKEYVVRWIQRLSGVRTNDPLESNDLRSIVAVLKRRRALTTIHSGNPLLKAKLKVFDTTEFVLPSIAEGRSKGVVNLRRSRHLQSTDSEPSSLTSEYTKDVKPDIEIKDEELIELKMEVTVEEVSIDEDQGEVSSGAGQTEDIQENESSSSSSSSSNKEEEEQTTNKPTSPGEGTRQEEEEKTIEKPEEQITVRESDEQTKPPSKMTTRRASMMEREEKAKSTRRTRRASVTPWLEERSSNYIGRSIEKRVVQGEKGKGAVREDKPKPATNKKTEVKAKVSERRVSATAKRDGEKQTTEPDEGMKRETRECRATRSTDKTKSQADKQEQQSTKKNGENT